MAREDPSGFRNPKGLEVLSLATVDFDGMTGMETKEVRHGESACLRDAQPAHGATNVNPIPDLFYAVPYRLSLAETLAEIDQLRSEFAQQARSQAEEEHLRRELTVEAIYHTNHMAGNQLSLAEVRAIVEGFWAGKSQQELAAPPAVTS